MRDSRAKKPGPSESRRADTIFQTSRNNEQVHKEPTGLALKEIR